MSTSPVTRARPRTGPAAIAGAAVFLLAYLAVSPVSGMLATGDAPLPDAPATELAAYLVENPAATWATAILQAVSVLGLALFARAILPVLRTAGARVVTLTGVLVTFSVAAMLVSSVVAATTAVIAPDVPAETVGLLRQVNFSSGGVANVAVLGGYVLLTTRAFAAADQVGRPTRVLGYVAGTLAVLSLFSIVFWYANAFLPAGRVLCMLWTVVAAIALVRTRERS